MPPAEYRRFVKVVVDAVMSELCSERNCLPHREEIGAFNGEWPPLMAASICMSVPLISIFAALPRNLISD